MPPYGRYDVGQGVRMLLNFRGPQKTMRLEGRIVLGSMLCTFATK